MSTMSDFDAPNFGEVIAYLHGVADGIRASRRGTATLGTCAAPPARPCRVIHALVGLGRTVCDEGSASTVMRRTMPYIPQPIDTTWPRLVAAPTPTPRWLDASSAAESAESADPPVSPARRTVPFLSSAVSIGPTPPSGFPVDDRTSGVCLRVIPPSAEWYQLTGTDDEGGFGTQGR